MPPAETSTRPIASPSMFESVHGSAPDIAGRQIANPIATIWAGAIMLDHLREREAAVGVIRAAEAARAVATPAMGGHSGTFEVAAAIAAQFRQGR